MAYVHEGRTTVILWPETKELAAAVTLQMSIEAGRPLTRTEMINMLVKRMHDQITQAKEETP